jgi:hypothetical protein
MTLFANLYYEVRFYRGVSKIRIKTMHGLDSKRAWKILYYFIMFCIQFYFSRLFLCSHYFPTNFLFSHKIVDISVLTQIGSAPPVPTGSGHLFGINAGVLFGVELVLI